MKKHFRMSGAVLLLLLILAPGVSGQFGPGPDPKEIERQRQYFVQKRAAMGDDAFKVYAIATLNRLLDAHHPQHPRYEALSQQRGTAEYILRTEQGFFTQVVPMLVEMDADEAMPVLAEHFKIFKHRWRHRASKNGRLGSGLDQQYALVADAWFQLAAANLGIEEATEQYAEMSSKANALYRQVGYLLDKREQQGDAFEGWPYLSVSLDEPECLFMQLATMPTGFLESGTALGRIDAIARHKAWSVGRDDMKQVLTHEDMRVRVALATVGYRQADLETSEMKQPFPDVIFQLDPGSTKWFMTELNAADLARYRLVKVWNQLLQQRTDLNQQIPGRNDADFVDKINDYRKAIYQNNDLLNHFYRLSVDNTLDPVMVDLCIETLRYTGAFIHLVRYHEKGDFTFTDEQLDRAAKWINDPFALESQQQAIVDGLIQLDHGGAADDIAIYYQRKGLLDGLTSTPKLRVNPNGVPYHAQLDQDVLDWLEKHGRQEQP